MIGGLKNYLGGIIVSWIEKGNIFSDAKFVFVILKLVAYFKI